MLLHGETLLKPPSIQLHPTDIGFLRRGIGATVSLPAVKCPLKDLLTVAT